MKYKNLALCALSAALLASCSSKRDTLSYFQDINTESFTASVNPKLFEPKIEVGDELNITVSSIKPELSALYNLPYANPATSENGVIKSTTPQQATYYVDSEGNITMPLLGKIHVAGLTVDQLAANLTERISKDVEEPTVVVTLLNFKIDVTGEVVNPGQISVKDKRFSILDALAAAGDLSPFGDRSRVMLIREENGQRTVTNIDLTSADILSSPYFYMKQNDVIYVAPNDVRKDNAKYNQNNAYKLTVVSTVVSAASVIASLVIALTIK